MRVAAIDVGSNSLHMVVAEVDADGRFHVLDRAKEMVRLGAGTLRNGELSAKAMDDGVRTLATFKTLAERLEVSRVQAVATSAVREAANGGDFIKRVKDEVGWRVKVIQGREEARLIFLGVRHAIDLVSVPPSLIVDIGGGSVELILVEDGQAVWMDSLKLGVARLSDLYLPNDPPKAEDLQTLGRAIDDELATVKGHLKSGATRVIGTSGTMLNLVTMAARANGEPITGGVHNLAVDATDIRRIRKEVCRCGRGARAKIKGLDAKRADLIVAGAVVADRILSTVGATTVTACTWSLREGVLLDFISRHQEGIEEVERFESPRIRSVVRLARHLGETSQHGTQVAKLALLIFDQVQEELDLPPQSREWLQYASLLHDIGHHIAHKNHHRHSHYLIKNSELLGFDTAEIDVIALVAKYHRKATPKDSDADIAALPKNTRRVIAPLSAILRLADSLDRSHFGVVKDLHLERLSDHMLCTLDTGEEDAALEIWESTQRSKPLEQALSTQLRFATKGTE